MSGLEFTLRSAPDQRIDLSSLTPDKVAGLSEQEIANLKVGSSKDVIRAGDIFDIRPGDPSVIQFSGLTARCDKIGAFMTQGEIFVDGDAGSYFGANMKGGRLTLSGSAGAFAGGSLKGGYIEIKGNAGEFAGGAVPGETQGMRDGILHIRGNAGDRAGDRLRRGQMIVGGSAGDYAGSRMIAGTILIVGGVGSNPGFGMRRGSLILGMKPASMLATFVDCGKIDLGVLRLMKRALAAEGADYGIPSTRVHRFAGDMASLGKGEILITA